MGSIINVPNGLLRIADVSYIHYEYARQNGHNYSVIDKTQFAHVAVHLRSGHVVMFSGHETCKAIFEAMQGENVQ